MPVTAGGRPPLILTGALPRAGNHLLRGLLDRHPELVVPPDEDYFVRFLLRSRWNQLAGALSSPRAAPKFFRRLQKRGHLERINQGLSRNASGTEGTLDLERYYEFVRSHHRRFSVAGLIRTHVGALAAALGAEGEGRTPVVFCAVSASKRDVLQLGRRLAALFDLRAIFVVRDPRAQFASKRGRKPEFEVERFCELQNTFGAQLDAFSEIAPMLRVRFEELVTDTEASMRRVCDFLGIAYDEGLTTFTQVGQPTLSNSSYAPASGIDVGTLTRYRQTVAPETLRYIESHCLPALFWRGSGEDSVEGL
jgi:hypothetical protein